MENFLCSTAPFITVHFLGALGLSLLLPAFTSVYSLTAGAHQSGFCLCAFMPAVSRVHLCNHWRPMIKILWLNRWWQWVCFVMFVGSYSRVSAIMLTCACQTISKFLLVFHFCCLCQFLLVSFCLQKIKVYTDYSFSCKLSSFRSYILCFHWCS